MEKKKISSAQVCADFNDLPAVIHYTRAAHELGLWKSERILIERFFPDRSAHLLEAGCGAGRVTLGLWNLGFREITAFDFAHELVDQAISLALERKAEAIRFMHADATTLTAATFGPPSPRTSRTLRKETKPSSDTAPPLPRKNDGVFGGALFMFNGLMQIPGRANRRAALRGLRAVCAPGAPLLFTTHDREHSVTERAMWRLETMRWARGDQDPRLVEFGDRYFEDEAVRTFMHLPDRAEILADLTATGWTHEFDVMRTEIARESNTVRHFSDECRFWVARKP